MIVVEEVTHTVAAPFDQPRAPRSLRREDWGDYAVAAASAVSLTMLLRVLLDWDDLLGSALLAFLAFLAIHFVLVSVGTTPEVALDRTVTTLIWSIAGIMSATLVWLLATVVVKGLDQFSWGFLTHDVANVGPLDSGGGSYHALWGTFEQVGMAMLACMPVAILTAVYLHEIGGRMARPIRFFIDALAGVPSIVAGLLVFSLWPGYSGFRASIALFILALPIVTRTAEEMLRTVPDSLRESALALGAPQWRVVMRVVLPTARGGLLTGGILGIARAAGETAPVLLTAFGSRFVNRNVFGGPQSSLPLFIYDMIRVPNELQNARAWAAMLELVIIVLLLFATARILMARSERRLKRRR